jgi:peroxiredoxin
MVELSLVLGRVVLAGVLALAGIAKLLDGRGARASVMEFGIPARVAPAVALTLPVAELVLAITLLPDATAAWSSAAATALLAVFLALVAVNLARGKRPHCRCFGAFSSGPVGHETLVRNAALTALAGVVSWGTLIEPNALAGSMGLLAPMQWIGLAVCVLALCVYGIQAWATLQLIAQQGRLLLRIEALEEGLRDPSSATHARQSGTSSNHKQSPPVPQFGLPVGSRAPDFRLRGLDGRTRTLADLLMPDRQLFLAFMDPGCGPCTALLPQIARWQREYAQTLKVAVISRGDHAANLAYAQQYGLSDILLQDDYEVAEAYRSYGTPGAVLIGSSGLIASHIAPGAEAIVALVNSAARQAAAARSSAPQALSSKLGDPAPSFILPDLDGREVSFADFRGQPTLVVFWNPSCGFCKSALPGLRAWAGARDQDDAVLLVVSTGTAEANKAMRIPGRVVLDAGADVMRAFGVGGTPMAVLVDAEGNIASRVAAGGEGVLALVRRAQSNEVAVPLVPAEGRAANG